MTPRAGTQERSTRDAQSMHVLLYCGTCERASGATVEFLLLLSESQLESQWNSYCCYMLSAMGDR